MRINFFSLCCLCKLAAHVVVAWGGDGKSGEKNCVFYIFNFLKLSFVLSRDIHTCCKKYPFWGLLKSPSENIGTVLIFYLSHWKQSCILSHFFLIKCFPANSKCVLLELKFLAMQIKSKTGFKIGFHCRYFPSILKDFFESIHFLWVLKNEHRTGFCQRG